MASGLQDCEGWDDYGVPTQSWENVKRIVMAAWMLHGGWGGSRSTKPCAFPCKVAAGGDDRYLVCVAGAAAIVLIFFWFPLGVLQRVVAHVCVVLCAC